MRFRVVDNRLRRPRFSLCVGLLYPAEGQSFAPSHAGTLDSLDSISRFIVPALCRQRLSELHTRPIRYVASLPIMDQVLQDHRLMPELVRSPGRRRWRLPESLGG